MSESKEAVRVDSATYNGFNEIYIPQYLCPKCGMFIGWDNNYCYHCGVKLDWVFVPSPYEEYY